jgi:hypothetical protein
MRITMAGLERVNNCIRIPVSLDYQFFRTLVEFLAPLHHLTNREQDVLASLLKNRFELSYSISDEGLLDKVLMSEDIKAKIKEECNVSDAFFQVILGKLRKTGVIIEGKINSKFIPKNLKADDKSFQLLLYFDLNAANN